MSNYSNVQLSAMNKAIQLLGGSPVNYKDLPSAGKALVEAYLDMPFETKHNHPDILPLYACKNPEDVVGRWAFFLDISILNPPEEAFGLIQGARYVPNGLGMKYFVKRFQSDNLMEMYNTSPTVLLIDEAIPEDVALSVVETDICSRFLNTYCKFKMGDDIKTGFIRSFGEGGMKVSCSDDEEYEIESGKRDEIILETWEKDQHITFGVSVTQG